VSLEAALRDILSSVEAGRGTAFFTFDAVQTWGRDALDSLVSQGLLKPASALQSIECRGCEEHCFSDVVVWPAATGEARAFVVCEHPDKQAEMGRIPVAVERLQQWRCDGMLLALNLCRMLGLGNDGIQTEGLGGYRLGMLKSPHGRRWATLSISPLALVVNRNQMPLSELLCVDGGAVGLDSARIQLELSVEQPAQGKQYTPNTNKREVRKLGTQAIYQDWRDAHARLKQEFPGHTKSWYARKIARMDVSGGKDYETIRKRLV